MRHAVLLAFTCAALAAAAEEPTAPAAAQKVEALSDEELDALEAPVDGGVQTALARAPALETEHAFDRRLLAFPLVLVALLAWNTRWRSVSGRGP